MNHDKKKTTFDFETVLGLDNDTMVYVENAFPYMDSLLRIVKKSL